MQTEPVTLYISDDDWFKDLNSNPASWKKNRNLDSDSVYVGSVINGLPNGQGTGDHPNGEKHVGMWKDGKKDGQGTFTHPDGSEYVGEWKDGAYDGQGTLTLPDGREMCGLWRNDKFVE